MPQSLGVKSALRCCAEISDLPSHPTYELDFSETQHFEPFGTLLVGASVRRLRERTTSDLQPVAVRILGRDDSRQGHSYAHRLGFWWSIGDDVGLPTVSTSATTTTIPITRLSVADLYRRSAGADPVRSETVSRAAGEVATTLCGSSTPSALWLALEYSFREMFRNIVEHSRADSIWYTAATRPSRDDVQVAILDGGRGIRDSLAENPNEIYQNDEDAIRAAIRPGVSRNTGKSRSTEQTQRLQEQFPDQDLALYDNSGFGLTLTSNLGKEAGQFAIVSGKTSLAYLGHHEVLGNTSHFGTAIRLVLHPTKIDGALERATLVAKKEARSKPGSNALISASMMSRLGIKGS